MEDNIVINLTKEQFEKLNVILDNESDMCDAFFDGENLKSYDNSGKAIFLTPQEYVASRLDNIID